MRTFLVILLTVFSVPTLARSSNRPLAYVYHGEGVCEGCPESLKTNIQKAGFRVAWIRPGEITAKHLAKASLFAVPGGEEERDVKRALQKGETENIQEFVRQGGHYLGVCLGAYLVPQWLPDEPSENGLELFSGIVTNHSPTKEARMEKISWRGNSRWMYFQDGPEFRLSRKFLRQPQVEIWARYSDDSLAALQVPYGLGRVGLVGPHAEADQSWLDDDHLIDPDGFDSDLLVDFLNGLTQKTYRARRVL